MSDERDVIGQERPAEPVQDAEEAPASAPVLSREDILSADDRTAERVDVPEWDGAVLVRALSGAERDTFEQTVTDASRSGEMDMRGIRAQLVALAVGDADGNRVFSDDDVEALQAKSAAALDRVFTVAQRLNNMTEEDIDELVGN